MNLLGKLLTMVAIMVVVFVLRSDVLAEQPRGCDGFIKELEAAIERCTEINSGWACYGNDDTLAEPEGVRFYKPGDRRPLQELTSIVAKPDVGAALMYFYTTGKEDPVTMILYGGAQLDPSGRAFALTVSKQGYVCEDSPPGVVAFTQSGKRGKIEVNGVTIELKSVAFLTMADPDTMIVSNVAGRVTASAEGEPQLAISKGWQLAVAGVSDGEPSFADAIEPSPFSDSPVVAFLAANLGNIYDPNSALVSEIPDCGGTIRIGQSVLDEIHAPGQECLYTFCPDPEDKVTISVEAVGQSPLNPYVDLRAADLTFVAGNNDRSGNDPGSLICNIPVSPTSCDQTIVVRSNRNESTGPFRLTLDGETSCTTPECFCQVTAAGGLNLRKGPGTQYPRVRQALPQGFIVEPLACTENREWYYVTVAEFGVTGWIRAHPDFVDCEPCIECKVPTPGISVSVSLTPSGKVVVSKMTVSNTGETPLKLKSVTNILSGNRSEGLSPVDNCSRLVGQWLAGGDSRSCSGEIGYVSGDFVRAVATALAEDRYGTEVEGSATATLMSSCEAPEFELLAEPAVYTIQDQCGSAEFKLSMINKSARPIVITSMTLDGKPFFLDREAESLCSLPLSLNANEEIQECKIRVPADLDDEVCGKNGQEISFEIAVTASATHCKMSKDMVTIVKVRFEHDPPDPCPKCGPYGEQ